MTDNLPAKPYMHTAEKLLKSGMHPISVVERLKHLEGVDAPLEEIVALRNTMPEAIEKANGIFGDEVLNDPLTDYHRTFALRKQRLERMIELEELSGEPNPRTDDAIEALEQSAERLARLHTDLGLNMWSDGEQQKETPSIELAVILQRASRIRGDVVDGEVKELDD